MSNGRNVSLASPGIFHVLSRTVDAGLDYTNRTNFIAHHVVFQPHELHGACSPADFLLYWPGWLSRWESDPTWTDDQAASLHSVQSVTSLPAENWAGWSGNAANAALLFESDKPRDTALVVEPGQESALVYLFAESLPLLNPDRDDKSSQWQIPFTTFFQAKDEVADFRWRGIWPEANRAKAERGALVLDLRNPSSFPLASGALAEWASTGIAPRAVLPAEIAPAAESELAATEERTAESIPAPSDSLRQWFSHDRAKWHEFQQRYGAELDANSESLKPLLEAAKEGNLTLLYSAQDIEHNNAIVLKHYLEKRLKPSLRSGAKSQ